MHGYYIALIANTGEFQISSLLDPTTWNASDVGEVQEFPGNIVVFIEDHDELWLFGNEKTCVYVDTGNALFPFELLPVSKIEQGCAAQFSIAKLDNSIFWLGGDERGEGIVWRAYGYTPQRVSTHAVELAIAGYSQISDAVAYAYQSRGHSFYVIHFPTPNKTWVYDASTGHWHERNYRNPSTGLFSAHRSQCHTYNSSFGAHLVGDWSSGKIFQMSASFNDDAGDPIQRVRTTPHVAKDNDYLAHHALELLVETGLGTNPPLLDASGNPRGPQVMMQFSDDGSKTWSNEHVVDIGQAGQYKTRARFNRLGTSRDRVYKVYYTDPVPLRITGALLEVS